jgi:acyl carrier protein
MGRAGMTNREKYDRIFMTQFSLESHQLGDGLEYNTIAAWDSIGHMTLIAEIEETFGIVLDGDDIIGFSSYGKGVEILTKYNLQF